MADVEKLKSLIQKLEEGEFEAVFEDWLDAHDDKDITCMSDVVYTLIEEIEAELDAREYF